jgi:voltage-gated potassium channel
MNNSLQRVRFGLLLLTFVFVGAVCGYKLVAGYSWLESIWLVVVTSSTVGFSERASTSPAVQILTVVVILSGVSAFAYTSSVLLQALLDGEFRRALGVRKMNRQIAALDRHVIVCGYGRLGQDLTDQLRHRRIPFLVLDISEVNRPLAESNDVLLVQGDATSEDVLLSCGIKRARSIVCALSTDADNVFVALTARNLAPGIQIVARSEHASSCKKLRQAGADKIVMPYQTGAQQMERMISRPSTADLLELFSEATNVRVELDEFEVAANSSLAGQQLEECGAARDYGLITVGLKNGAGELLFNPPANTLIAGGDTLLVLGALSDITRFRTAFGL